MFSRGASARIKFLLGCLLLGSAAAFGQIEPQGLLIYEQPSTTYAEVFEYRSFRQDNALYATVVNSAGERKQLKAGGVMAVLPYPPTSFDSYFASTAQTALEKIDSLERKYPDVRLSLEQIRGKWMRALSVFNQEKARAAGVPNDLSGTLSIGSGVFKNARLTSATPENATITHATGITTVAMATLTPTQILSLNRNSDKVQLPLGIGRPVARSTPAPEDSDATLRVEAVGRTAISFCAEKLGVSPEAFHAWTFFVALPGLVVLLLLGLILAGRRSARGSLLHAR